MNYRTSFLSDGNAGKVCGGDRLPWVNANGIDNFLTLKTLDWQIHVYGELEGTFQAEAEALNILIVSFEWSCEAKNAGLRRNASYLIRPDGYVALACPVQNAATLRHFCEVRELIFRRSHS